MPREFQQYPGRVKIEEILIEKFGETVDVTPQFLEFNVYASIKDVTAIQRLLLLDARNLLSNLPVEAGDRTHVTVSYLDTQKTFTGRVNSIKSIEGQDQQRKFVIESISELAYNSLFQRISRSFRGTTSEIAQAIFNQHTHENIGIWDQSVGSQSLVIPNWSPIKTIDWLTGRSMATFDNVYFRFYQDANLNYNFMPLERSNLLYQEAPITYRHNAITTMTERAGDQIPNSQAVVESILNLSYNDSFNMKDAVPKLKSVRYRTDPTFKDLQVLTYNHWEQFEQNDYLNDKSLWQYNDIGLGKVVMHTWHTETTGNGTSTANNVDDITVLRRSTYDNSQMIDITVNGTQTVDIGQVVNIEIPSPEPHTDEMKDQLDLRWSGRYYVVGIRNMYTRDGHQTALTLAKESLMQEA